MTVITETAAAGGHFSEFSDFDAHIEDQGYHNQRYYEPQPEMPVDMHMAVTAATIPRALRAAAHRADSSFLVVIVVVYLIHKY